MNQVSLLQKYFGFSSFRRGQKEAVQHILQGSNTLVIMPTGAGKSLIYQYSALALAERSKDIVAVTLVISPLIALMKDQVDNLRRHEISATYINSTLSVAEQRQRSNQMLQGLYSLVYVAPERLRQSSFIEALKNIVLHLFVIDEAHCISSWGHDFRPDYRRIAGVRKELGQPLTIALTATATSLVQNDIVELLGIQEAPRVVTGFNRPNLSFEVFHTSGTHSKLQEIAFLLQEQSEKEKSQLVGGACIIYVATRKEAEEVASFIGQKLSLPCAYYHAGLAGQRREQIQNAFSNGNLPIVIATNAFGMGIDRKDVRLVIHYNIPGTLEAYYQEAGRAGRDGLPSRAILLYSVQDRSLQEFFIRQNSFTLQQLHQLYQCLQNLPQTEGSRIVGLLNLGKLLGWEQQKLRLGLSYLEKAGILENTGFAITEEIALRLTPLALGNWDEKAARVSTRQIEEYSQHRKNQLEQMGYYAQAESCRRQILLSYFSDPSDMVDLSANRCCDYCYRKVLQQKKNLGEVNSLAELSRIQRAALIVLDSVRLLSKKGFNAGRQRIAQMLSGSQSQKMTENFQNQRYYGRLKEIGQKQIEMAIDELLQKGYLRQRFLKSSFNAVISASTGFVIELGEQGNQALQLREAICLRSFEKLSNGKLSKSLSKIGANKKEVRLSTTSETLDFLQQGMTLEKIAEVRGLSPRTISTHISSLIEQGFLQLEDYVNPDVRQTVEKCLKQLVDSGEAIDHLRPIKDQLPPEISYDELKFVLGAWKRNAS